MSDKRKRSERDETHDQYRRNKKLKKGFKVGPDSLPDGTYKRKAQKIKSSLIQDAKIKKDYAKLKRQGNIPNETEKLPQPAFAEPEEEAAEPSTAPHPDRQELIDNPDTSQPDQAKSVSRQRKPKSTPYKREYEAAQKRKAEAEERRKAREDAERQRQQKIEERERFRKAMAKARTGGPNGQRKLGRESKVLLEKVKRMVGEAG